jgi:nucleoside-diphosphate-sugar epimerase
MSATTSFLIAGATGNIGARIVGQLLERGQRPRVFVRNAGKALRFEAASDDDTRHAMLAGMPAVVVEGLLSLWRAVREGKLASVTDGVERVLGRKPIAFSEWAAQNAAAFC